MKQSPNREDMEREANYFAMCLLMPEALVRAYVRSNGSPCIADDTFLSAMARKFGVSHTLAAIRLHDLGILMKL